MFSFYSVSSNKNARIRNRVCKNGKLRTETVRRDFGSANAAVTTDTSTNSTKLFIDLEDGTNVTLTGNEARTLYRLLSSHYHYTGKSV